MRAQKLKISALAIALFLFATASARAEEWDIRIGEVFMPVTAETLNAYNTAHNLGEFKQLTGMFYEGNYRLPFLPNVSVGPRFTFSYAKSADTTVSTSVLTPYNTNIQSHSANFIMRVDLLQWGVLRADAFGSIGTQGTKINIRTTADSGSLDKNFDGASSANTNAYGVSVSLGLWNVYIVGEAGIQYYNADSLNLMTGGTAPATVREVDFSGMYYSVGLMFTGIPFRNHDGAMKMGGKK
jgi:hypothetical protein